MKTLSIDLTYQPVGGALSQIIEIICNLSEYQFSKIIFFTTQENRYLFDGIKDERVVIHDVNFGHTQIFRRLIWAQCLLPFLILFKKIDILFCPGNISPILSFRKKAQWIGTVGPFEKGFIKPFPFFQKFILFFSKYLMIFSSHTSDLVFFESNYTKNLFTEKYRLKKDKAVVLHIGKDNFYQPKKKDAGEKYILSVSHLYPYKNFHTLINAFFEISIQDPNIDLLIAGSVVDKSYFEDLMSLIKELNIENRVFFLGRVEKDQLNYLYSNCLFFVFHSPFENFAYTLIEAMSCGAAIVSTNTTAMPETCSDAAIYFNPYSVKELVKCMKFFIDNPENIGIYSDKSLNQAKIYPNYEEINKETGKFLNEI